MRSWLASVIAYDWFAHERLIAEVMDPGKQNSPAELARGAFASP